MGVTAFPFDAVLDVTPNTLLGNDTATAAPAKALTTTQVRALLGVYTTAQVDALLSGKSDAGHTHAYSSLTGIPATFPPSTHNQAWSTITGTPTTLAGYGITDAAASGHTHPQSDVTGLTSALAAKADLVGGLVPASQLPSFVDDVLEYANLAAFPGTGESGKIYVALDTSRTYRWGGSTYVELTDSTAVWGSISGVLANQTDLASALSGKSDTSHTHAYSSLTGIPSNFAPTAHKATHATGQPDALSPSDIGAVPTSRTLTINGTAFDLSADRSWTVAGGISSLNGLTDATQTFQTGTTGTNFGIVSTAGVHTFNLPDASATARGVVTTGAQTFAGQKTFVAPSTTLPAITVQAVAGQTGPTQTWVDSSGNVQARFTGGGNPVYYLAFGKIDFGYNSIGYVSSNVLAMQVSNVSYTFHSGSGFAHASQGGLGYGWGSAYGIANGMWGWFGTSSADSSWTDLQVGGSPKGTVAAIAGLDPSRILVYCTRTNQSNYERLALQFVAYASGRYAQLACESAGTGIANMNLVLSPKGTGALIAGPMPDGTATGGNARGGGAVDLQITREFADQVASGSYSIILAGLRNKATGRAAVAGGYTSTASGSFEPFAYGTRSTASGSSNSWATGFECVSSADYAHARGFRAAADRFGMQSESCANHNLNGDAQHVRFFAINKTTDGSTPVTLFLNGSSIRLTIPSGKILFATMHIVGGKSDGSAVATYMRKFAIKNVGGTTTLVGSVETIGTDVAAGTSLSITADDTNDAINAAVIGVNGETWRWAMTVHGVELAYGT